MFYIKHKWNRSKKKHRGNIWWKATMTIFLYDFLNTDSTWTWLWRDSNPQPLNLSWPCMCHLFRSKQVLMPRKQTIRAKKERCYYEVRVLNQSRRNVTETSLKGIKQTQAVWQAPPLTGVARRSLAAAPWPLRHGAMMSQEVETWRRKRSLLASTFIIESTSQSCLSSSSSSSSFSESQYKGTAVAHTHTHTHTQAGGRNL